jgi:chromosome segregation ATPase
MTSSLKIPPVNLQNQYGAIACFVVPRAFLDRELKFFLMLKNSKVVTNHSMPNCNAGYIEVIDDLIKTSYYSKNHDRVPFKVSWFSESIIYSTITHSRCVVEISVRPVEVLNEDKGDVFKKDLNFKSLRENIVKSTLDNYTLNLSNVPDKEKWDILSKELSQKQELIHRMMKEVDEKSEALKLTGSEIIELRKQIKLLQSENTILRKRLGQEEQMQIESVVTQEIHKMSLPELKSKIIKLAQAYRSERMRNEEFNKALRQAQNEIANARKISQELEEMQKLHEEDTQKFLDMQKETQKVSLYRETIKKQEIVIQKYETLLKTTINDSNRQKESLLELEQLRTENLKLQKELKDLIINSVPGTVGKTNPEIEKYKKEVDKLEKVIKGLQEELSNRRPLSTNQQNVHSEFLELEVKYHKVTSRVRALEDELNDNSRRYAQEISRLKMILSEKESIIETLRMENI